MDIQSIAIDRHNFMRFSELCQAMANRRLVRIWAQGAIHTGWINGIQAENDSGRNWNVTICNEFGSRTVFVKAQ